MMSSDRSMIEDTIHPYWRATLAPLTDRILAARAAAPAVRDDYGHRNEAAAMSAAVIGLIRADMDVVRQLKGEYELFVTRSARAAVKAERDALMLEFAARLGGEDYRQRTDRRALSKWLNEAALRERFLDRVGQLEWQIKSLLERLGALGAEAVTAGGDAATAVAAYRVIESDRLFVDLFQWAGDGRVRVAAFEAMTRVVGALPAELQQTVIDNAVLQLIYRQAQDKTADVWVQRAAFRLLRSLSLETFAQLVEARLSVPGPGDDFFVRHFLVRSLRLYPELASRLGALACNDPSDYVRQALASIFWLLDEAVRTQLLRRDPVAAVRGMAVLAAMGLRSIAELPVEITPADEPTRLRLMRDVLANEEDPFVLKAALKAVRAGFDAATAEVAEGAVVEAGGRWFEDLRPMLVDLAVNCKVLEVRRRAAETHEWLWVRSDLQAFVLFSKLGPVVRSLRPGRSKRLAAGVLDGCRSDVVGRVLSVLAQGDFGLELIGTGAGARLRRGDRFGFRLWRFWHEMRLAAPDKRQGHSHVTGRIVEGAILAPSSILGEVSQTKVPGEPYVVADEQSWRPFLPLPDHLISSVDGDGLTQIYTAQGVTEIRAPDSLAVRLATRMRLTFGFSRLSALRNWEDAEQGRPDEYLNVVGKMGLRVGFRTHDERAPDDPAVRRFFPAVFPVLDGDLLVKFRDYFFSVYQNSLGHLAVFVVGALALFLGNHFVQGLRMRRARKALTLVIGGWGTRGKSGTERLKAALINGLGHGVMSKTTGCEAMFVFARAFRPLREMFLFRPFDKATIWEQLNVAVLARRLGLPVFLWECMGLTPSYVHILQRQWMRDDLSTLTNTYPDHEDIQGPAGHDIPRVMINFIPKRGVLLTSEEEMRPILADGAGALETPLIGVGWLEAGLLTNDVLARFPYLEHPYNIALVLAMAEQLGIDRDFALKEMADRVVPDLGVLKAYPTARLSGRTLIFINGMSANERFGCLGNWRRLGMQRMTPAAEPGKWVVTVVNNRADRVPRSWVFANVLVNDISADRHVLIGSNLEGLSGFIDQAWQTRVADASLAAEGADPAGHLKTWAEWLRVPTDQAVLRGRLAAMLQGLAGATPDPSLVEALGKLDRAAVALGLESAAPEADVIDDLVASAGELVQNFAAYTEFAEKIAATGAAGSLDQDFRDLLTDWFKARIVVVEDFYATGEQVIQTIVRATPPGLEAQVMGIQNIKGTGLDFVYRWQDWEKVWSVCRQAQSDSPDGGAQGLEEMAAIADYGLLGAPMVADTMETVKASRWVQTEAAQARIRVIEGNLRRTQERLGGARSDAGNRGTSSLRRWFDAGLGVVERFLDAGDAVRRRRAANSVYDAMAEQTVDSDKAALLVRELNRRQKGGWLKRQGEELMGGLFGSKGATRD